MDNLFNTKVVVSFVETLIKCVVLRDIMIRTSFKY